MTKILKIGRLLEADPEGYLVNECSLTKIQSPWKELVEEVKKIYLDHLPSQLHSLYLRGSVPRGDAIEGLSDLDSFAVVREPENQWDLTWVGAAQEKLRAKYPFCPYVEFAFVPFDKLLRQAGFLSYRFIIKVLAACCFGEDLAPQFPKFRPNLKLAFFLHGNILEVLQTAKRKLQRASSPVEVRSACSWATKRLIRTGFSLVMEEERTYTRDLFPCYEIFSKHYPEKEPKMREALELAVDPSGEKEKILSLLDSLGAWLATEAQRKFLGR